MPFETWEAPPLLSWHGQYGWVLSSGRPSWPPYLDAVIAGEALVDISRIWPQSLEAISLEQKAIGHTAA